MNETTNNLEQKVDRESWDQYFAKLASAAATRSTCPRLSVGAVIVKNREVIATGYNGALRGGDHCLDKGCIIKNEHCMRCIHAEMNAIFQATHGTDLSYSTMYVTANPCINCYMAIYQVGIKRVIYTKLYKEVDYDIFGLNSNIKIPIDLLK